MLRVDQYRGAGERHSAGDAQRAGQSQAGVGDGRAGAESEGGRLCRCIGVIEDGPAGCRDGRLCPGVGARGVGQFVGRRGEGREAEQRCIVRLHVGPDDQPERRSHVARSSIIHDAAHEGGCCDGAHHTGGGGVGDLASAHCAEACQGQHVRMVHFVTPRYRWSF